MKNPFSLFLHTLYMHTHLYFALHTVHVCVTETQVTPQTWIMREIARERNNLHISF